MAQSDGWSVDVPGLTEDGAHEIVEFAAARGLGEFGNGYALDPSVMYVRHMDKATVEMIVARLRGRGTGDGRGDDVQNVLEDMEDWLTRSR